MELFKISIFSICVLHALPAMSQISTQNICLNNVRIELDTSWIAIVSPRAEYIRYEEDDSEDYEIIHYFNGRIHARIYQQNNDFWPGGISLASPQDTLVIDDDVVLPIVGQPFSAWPEDTRALFSQPYNKKYESTGDKNDVSKIPDISLDLIYIVNDNTRLYVSIVCILKKGILQRIHLSFTK